MTIRKHEVPDELLSGLLAKETLIYLCGPSVTEF